jgi:hypothetical protein
MTMDSQPPVKFVLRAGLFANQQAQLAFSGAFAALATVAIVISYFLGPGPKIAVGLVFGGAILAVNTDRFWPTRVVLGKDGVLVKLPFSQRLHAWDSIAGVSTSGFGVVLALRSGEKVTVRTHPDWAPRTDDEDTQRLSEALKIWLPPALERGTRG